MSKPFLQAGYLVAPGDEKAKKLGRAGIRQLYALMTGPATLTIPLNGSSEERQDARAYWEQFADLYGLEYKCAGNCLVRINGPSNRIVVSPA